MKLLTTVLSFTLMALLLIPTAFADLGDKQVYAHAVLEASLDSTEIIDGGLGSEDYADGSIEAAHLNLVGDSVSVFATKTNVYSDSVVFGDTASIVVDHQVIGDSLAVTATNTKVYGTLTASGTSNFTGDLNASGDSASFTATATKVYGDFYLADCGVDSLSSDGAGLGGFGYKWVACTTVGDSSNTVPLFTFFAADVGIPEAVGTADGEVYADSLVTGAGFMARYAIDNASPVWFFWAIFRKAE